MKILKTKSHWFKIKAKDGRVLSFRINDSQKKILAKIENDIKEKGRCRIIIVKGRQLGISTLIEALLLSYAMTEPAFTGYCMAHDATTANDLFDKIIKFIWQNLNQELKQYYQVKRDNTRQIMFEGYMNSSSVTVGLSARGGTVDGLHISEAGKISTNNNLWNEMITGTFPASEKAKLIVIESTADGGLGKFYEMVQDSLAGKNDFETIFLSWTEADEYTKDIPVYDLNWKVDYLDLAKKLGLFESPDKLFGITDNQWYWYFKQAQLLKEEVKVQYPFTIDEAFISKSKNKFNINYVLDCIKQAKQPIEKMVINVNNPNSGANKEILIDVYHKPVNANYVMSIDTSSGLGNDYTAIKVRYTDGQKYREFLKIKQKLTEDETVQVALEIANRINTFGRCLIIPEVNFGSYVTNTIRDRYDNNLIYKRYIQDPNKQRDVTIPDYGWKTTGANRDLIINNFVRDFESGLIEVNSLTELDEMKYFVFNEENNRYEASQGQHDDELMADFICLQGFDYFREYL